MEIEKDIPLPDLTKRSAKYPFGELAIGESFFVEGAKRGSLATSAWAFGKKRGIKFVTRKVEKDGVSGVRIWRAS